MNRITRLSAVAVTGLSVLLVAGCGGGGSSSAAKPAQSTAAAPGQPAAPQPSAKGGGNGSGTITLSGDHGVYTFDSVSCMGARSVTGKLIMTATVGGDGKADAILTFDSGKLTVLMTVGNGDSATVVWTGESAIGPVASRTVDTVKLADLPMTATTLAGESGGITASGNLTCSGTEALI